MSTINTLNAEQRLEFVLSRFESRAYSSIRSQQNGARQIHQIISEPGGNGLRDKFSNRISLALIGNPLPKPRSRFF